MFVRQCEMTSRRIPIGTSDRAAAENFDRARARATVAAASRTF
jgi:hypothetical protein